MHKAYILGVVLLSVSSVRSMNFSRLIGLRENKVFIGQVDSLTPDLRRKIVHSDLCVLQVKNGKCFVFNRAKMTRACCRNGDFNADHEAFKPALAAVGAAQEVRVFNDLGSDEPSWWQTQGDGPQQVLTDVLGPVCYTAD